MSKKTLQEYKAKYERELKKLDEARRIANAPKLTDEEKYFIFERFLSQGDQIELAFQYGYAMGKGVRADLIIPRKDSSK